MYKSTPLALGLIMDPEASYELRAVVFDPEARRLWQPLTQRVKGDGRLLAGLGGGEGDSEAGVRLNEGEQAASQAIAQGGSTHRSRCLQSVVL